MSFTDEILDNSECTLPVDNTEETLPVEVSGGVHDTIIHDTIIHQKRVIVSTEQALAQYGLMLCTTLVLGSTTTACTVM